MSRLDKIGDVDGDAPPGVGFIDRQDGDNDVEVTAQDTVPYGKLTRNCTVKKTEMGTEVGDVSGYVVYDTDPASTGLRTHFITGFGDRCARQFSGALVLFGDVGTHELVRYADVDIDLPYTITDEAYEVIKSSFCRVGRSQPCGRRINRLAKSTTFVTIYESFADNSGWVDVLVHKGEVLASDINN